VRYSRLHIGSAQRFPEARRLTAEDIEARDLLTKLAGDPDLRLDMNFIPGGIQFLHNLFEWSFVGEGLVDQNCSLRGLLPSRL
jgi:hypothetical protein